MINLLVVSDSHLHNSVLQSIFDSHPDISTCIHCGDIQDDPSKLQIENLLLVQGNTDIPTLPKELFIDIEGKKILILHGHQQCVEDGLDNLISYGKSKKADIICFGHTHHPQTIEKEGLVILNPGSVAFPRGGKVFVPTYAILSLDHDIHIHFYHAKTHRCVDDLVLKTENKKKKKSFFSLFKK